ncbi:MAG: lipid-A-disaccharide synthase, partial [Deltaproteobacteria bacterium]|nr:lipid-A-disaccharide synthase [Deltaproteobacteria bacterium]
MPADRAPVFLVVACEASADQHGSRVVEAVRARLPEARFVGIGGDHCQAAGVELVGHARDLGLMGFSDVLFALPRVLRTMAAALAAARRGPARAALLIDAPDFNLRLARKLKAADVPVVYFISPKLWATRPGRAKLVRRFVKRMLVIFPFEVEFYRRRGVSAEYVGNPTVEQMSDCFDRDSARALLGVRPDEKVVALLPGSRRGEIRRIAPDLGEAARLLGKELPLRFLVPRAPTVDRALLEAAFGAKAPIEVVDGKAREILAAADAAVVAAGTATLEAALVNTPTVMVYRVSALSWLIYRLILRIPYISLINIIAERPVITELWQQRFTPAAVAGEV